MMTKLKYIIPTIIAVAIVIISTISIIQFINRKRYNPVKVLNEVKSYFMDIKGSYILHEPLQNKEQYLNRLVYQGGITQNKNNRDIEYTFYADAHTGEILTIEEN